MHNEGFVTRGGPLDKQVQGQNSQGQNSPAFAPQQGGIKRKFTCHFNIRQVHLLAEWESRYEAMRSSFDLRKNIKTAMIGPDKLLQIRSRLFFHSKDNILSEHKWKQEYSFIRTDEKYCLSIWEVRVPWWEVDLLVNKKRGEKNIRKMIGDDFKNLYNILWPQMICGKDDEISWTVEGKLNGRSFHGWVRIKMMFTEYAWNGYQRYLGAIEGNVLPSFIEYGYECTPEMRRNLSTSAAQRARVKKYKLKILKYPTV